MLLRRESSAGIREAVADYRQLSRYWLVGKQGYRIAVCWMGISVRGNCADKRDDVYNRCWG